MIKAFLLGAMLFCFGYASAQVDSLNNKASPDSVTPVEAVVMDAREKDDDEVYKLRLGVDIPVTAVGVAWSSFAFTKIYNKDNSTAEEILNLDKKDIPSFDRGSAGFSDPDADATSDILFYGSIPVPLVLLLDKNIRKDAGKIGFMWLEAFAITGIFYTGSVYFVDRYRPETYNKDLPLDERMSGGNKNSFLGGHPALVATGTFFTAKVYGDYHPDSWLKPTLYGVAIASTGVTAYLRYIAGKHFISDLAVGVTVGTLSGFLVPHFHKNKDFKDNRLGIYPYKYGPEQGLTLVYSFK